MEILTGLAGATLAAMIAKGIYIRRKINRFHRELKDYLEQDAPQSIRDYFNTGVINTEELTQDEANKLIPYFKREYELPVIAFSEDIYKEDAKRTIKLFKLVDRLEGNSRLYALLSDEGLTYKQRISKPF